MKQYAELDETVYLWFAANDTSGSGGDGATPAADVRLAGAAADAAPVYSPTPVLLSHINYPAGAYEIAIAATAANGFAANNTYAVFCTLLIDSQNPTGFVGSFDTKPVESNMIQIAGVAQAATDLDAMIKRILGMNQENFYIDNTVFASGNMTSCRIRIYSVAGSVGSASDVLATYTMTAGYSGDEMTTYKMVKA